MPLGEQADDQAKLEQALGVALAYVNRRERTVAEVHAQLQRKGISESCAEAAIGELVDQHLIDDERFAEMFVADKRTLEQWGTERIRRGLAARGVERELADRALSDADRSPLGGGWSAAGGPGDVDETAPVGELDRALGLLRRRFPEPPREPRERERAFGMLIRKGYESELAVDALAVHARGG